MSYVTGAHNMKVGWLGGYSTPFHDLTTTTEVVNIRMNNGVVNRLTENLGYGGGFHAHLHTYPIDFYAQDQWTVGRLTLQGGVRLDQVFSSFPEERIGGPGYPLMPVEIVFAPSSEGGFKWHDITPRMGAAYDVFGSGKTAVKFNLGKYMEGFQGSMAEAGQMTPLSRLAIQTNRSWVDTNRFVPNCDLSNPRRTANAGRWTIKRSGRRRSPDLGPELHPRLGHSSA